MVDKAGEQSAARRTRKQVDDRATACAEQLALIVRLSGGILDESTAADLIYKYFSDASTAEQSPEPHQEICPSCKALDSSRYKSPGGVAMRACGRCMIQWRESGSVGESPESSPRVCPICDKPMSPRSACAMGHCPNLSVGESPAPAHELVTCDLYQHKVVERNGDLTRLPHEQTSWCVNPERVAAPPEPATDTVYERAALVALTASRERIETLEQALRTIKLWIGNADRPLCQGGHRQHCDCLRREVNEIIESALSGESRQ